jgi:hypothetical protein
VELITGHGVTMVHFVPSMLGLFATEPGVAGVPLAAGGPLRR